MFHITSEVFTDNTNVEFGFVRYVEVPKRQVLPRTALERLFHECLRWASWRIVKSGWRYDIPNTRQGPTNSHSPEVVSCDHLTGDKLFLRFQFWFSLHPGFVVNVLKIINNVVFLQR